MAEDPWAFARDDLTDHAVARMSEDYDNRERFAVERPGGSGAIARYDFAAGWMAAMTRLSQWSWFTPAGRARLEKK